MELKISPWYKKSDFNKLVHYYRETAPRKMAIAANRVRSRMMNSIKRRSYTSRGKKPAPSTSGTAPHSISDGTEGKTKSGKPKKFYPMRVIKYEKIGSTGLRYAIGVAPFASRGKMTMIVPRVHEKGGTISRSRWGYEGAPHGKRKKISKLAKQAYRKKMQEGFADEKNPNHEILDKLKIKYRKRLSKYPARPYVRPAGKQAAQELPELFKFALHLH